MCGRFALSQSHQLVEDHFSVAGVEPFPPRYNIAPTQPVLTICAASSRPKGSNLPQRDALLMRWGLLPSWVKDPTDFPLLFNARSETVATKASFRGAIRHRRCLIPASGFYEWQRTPDDKRSQPYWIRPVQNAVLAFAGLWETWLGPDGSEIDTCAIVTTAAGSDLSAIHHRVPVTLRPDDYDRWLDSGAFGPVDVADLLVPVPGFFEAVPISDHVNKVANDGPELQSAIVPPALSDDEHDGASETQLTLL